MNFFFTKSLRASIFLQFTNNLNKKIFFSGWGGGLEWVNRFYKKTNKENWGEGGRGARVSDFALHRIQV